MATERGQWTIKSKRLDAELQNACRMAATRQGMATGDWVAETLRESARAVLTGDGTPARTPPPPVRVEDIREEVLAVVERRLAEMVERLVPQPVPQIPVLVPQPAPQAPEPVPQPVPQPADEREARRLRTMLRRARR